MGRRGQELRRSAGPGASPEQSPQDRPPQGRATVASPVISSRGRRVSCKAPSARVNPEDCCYFYCDYCWYWESPRFPLPLGKKAAAHTIRLPASQMAAVPSWPIVGTWQGSALAAGLVRVSSWLPGLPGAGSFPLSSDSSCCPCWTVVPQDASGHGLGVQPQGQLRASVSSSGKWLASLTMVDSGDVKARDL